MVATRQRPKPVTVADPDKKMTMAEGARMAGVSKAVMRDRRPELLEAGAVQLSATRWAVTARQMEAAGIIRIKAEKKKPEADPLEAAQAAREAERRANVADPYGARVRRSAEESQAAAAYAAAIDGRNAPGASDTAVTIAELRAEIVRLQHAAELAEARHRAELAETKAIARAHEDRSATMEILAKERGRTIAMLEALLGGAAPVTRALDA